MDTEVPKINKGGLNYDKLCDAICFEGKFLKSQSWSEEMLVKMLDLQANWKF